MRKRQPGRHVGHEVALAPLADLVHDRRGLVLHRLLQPGQHPGGEAGRHQPPEPGVAGVVHGDDRVEVLVELRRELVDGYASGRRVELRIARHFEDGGVPGYEPGARCLDVRQLIRELETGEERERPRAQGRQVVLDLVAVTPPEDVVDRVVVVGLRRGRRLDGGAGREDGHGIVDGTDCCRRPRAAIVVVVGRGVDPRTFRFSGGRSAN